MITTIQISEEIRTELKVIAAQRRISYGDLLRDFITMYEAMMPFKTDNEFGKWFEDNYGSFGFKEILEKKPHNLYVLKDDKNRIKKVYLTFILVESALNKFDSSNIDLIISVFSTQTEVDKIPVISLLKQSDPRTSIKIFEGRYTTVPLPMSLYNKVKEAISGTGFHDVPSYVSYILREILAEKEIQTEKKQLTSEDEEKVKQRLRALGYL
ncbi:hypothetical protein ACFLQ6_03645 [Thermoproteota archaeon]